MLIADDEPALRRTLARLLSARGLNVVTADDGAMAMELLGRDAVDVALVDLMMPRIGGLELLDYVRKHHPDVEVVIMTAFGDVDTAVKAVRAGARPRRCAPASDRCRSPGKPAARGSARRA